MISKLLSKIGRGLIYVMVGAALPLLVGCGSGRNQVRPTNFSIAVKTYSTNWRPAQSITIGEDGRAIYRYTPPGLNKQPITKQFTLSYAKLKKIIRTVNKVKFFELEPEYADRRWYGGWNCKVSVNLDGRAHKVHIIETEVKPVIKLLKTINSVSPEYVKFLYYVVF